MQRDTAVDLLMGRLGRRTNTGLRNDIINEMVQAQESILEGGDFLPWFLITNDDTLYTVADTETVTMPTDFIREWEDGGLWRATGDADEPWIYLARDDHNVIKVKYPGSGTPEKYDRTETELYLRPIPDSVIQLDLWYYAQDASLAGTYGGTGATTENGWLKWASDWLIAETGLVIATQYLNSQQNVVQKWVSDVQRAKDRVYSRDTEWREANKSRFMGDGR